MIYGPQHFRRQQQQGQGQDPQQQQPAKPAPGKVAHTDTMQAPPATGIPLVDSGARCDPPGPWEADADLLNAMGVGECFLAQDRRTYLVMLFHGVVGTAMDNYAHAINDARLELLTKSESGWGFLAEALFGVFSGPLGAVLVKALGKAKNFLKGADPSLLDIMAGVETPKNFGSLIASVSEDTIKNVVGAGTKGVREALKSRAKALATDDGGKAKFLQIVRDRIKGVQDAIMATAPAMLSDAELVAAYWSYRDEEAHSSAAYGAEVADLLSRYEQSGASEPGESRFAHETDISPWILAGGTSPLPVTEMKEHKKHLVRVRLGDQMRFALVESEGGPKEGRFLRWIDPEFVDIAIGTYEARGGTVVDVDVLGGAP